MNLAIAPNTPIAHSVPMTKRAFAHPAKVGDTFAATFGKTTPKVEDITTYTTFNEKELDVDFKANVSQGILHAMQSLQPMAQELLEEGYGFSVAKTSMQQIAEKPIAPDEIAYSISQIKQNSNHRSYLNPILRSIQSSTKEALIKQHSQSPLTQFS